ATLVYQKCNLDLKNPELHKESIEYGACSFVINTKKIEHRVAKITPTKSGQFVTIWKRNEHGKTQPFSILDDFDFIIITCSSEDNIGQFIFPKSVLAEQGIITENKKEGKRGIRVYPPWDTADNKQAQKTQAWQIKCFSDFSDPSATNYSVIKRLFCPILENI
ncbi:MAG TPA: MepB family protein, partial [Flavobacterium sp.]|nr:MepB family protein [Flavobacterium sp.]